MNFEGQFSIRKKIDTKGGVLEIIDIIPDQEKGLPVFLSSGWASTPELLKPLLKTINKNDRRVITVDFKKFDRINTKKHKGIAREKLKSQAILEVAKILEIEKMDIISHSEGAVYTTFAVEDNPSIFKNLLLIAPAGMISNQSFLETASKFILDTLLWPIKKMRKKNRPLYHVIQNIKFFILNPIQSLQEGYGLSKVFIAKKIDFIIKSGVNVNLIYFNDDLIFPYKKVKQNAEVHNIPTYLIEGSHNFIYSNPEIFWSKIKGYIE
jgi:pimeloyl-ACP methyl ester carboxylesterase